MNSWRKWLLIVCLLAALLPVGRATLLADSSGPSPDTVLGESTSAADAAFGVSDEQPASVEPEPAANTDAAAAVDSNVAVDAAVDASAAPAEAEAASVAGEAVDALSKPAALPVWRTLEPEYSSATPLPTSGIAMYYNPGVMDTVIESRLKYDQIEPCESCIGYIAMLRYGDLNRKVWLEFGESRLEGPFHVVDAAATQHVGMLLSRGWAVDVDHETALRWNKRMPYVTIWDKPPLDLLLANYTKPLHWNVSLPSGESVVQLPQSENVPPDDSHIVVKHDVAQRSRTMQSFVDLAADRPPELYVK